GDCQHVARLIKQGDTPLTPPSMSDTDSELSVLSMASDEEMEERIRSSLPKLAVVVPRLLMSPSSSPHPKKAVPNIPPKGSKRFSDGNVKTAMKKVSVPKATASAARASTQLPLKKSSKTVLTDFKAAKPKSTTGVKPATKSKIPIAKSAISKAKPAKVKI